MLSLVDDLRKLGKELGITEEEVLYVLTNPCLEGSERCSRYKAWREKYYKILKLSNVSEWIGFFIQDNCRGCINFNGFLVIKTGPYEKPRIVEKTMKALKEKFPPLYRFVKKKYDLRDT